MKWYYTFRSLKKSKQNNKTTLKKLLTASYSYGILIKLSLRQGRKFLKKLLTTSHGYDILIRLSLRQKRRKNFLKK